MPTLNKLYVNPIALPNKISMNWKKSVSWKKGNALNPNPYQMEATTSLKKP